MRFIHIENFFHPDSGYQVNLLSKIQVEQGHEVIVVTSEMKNVPGYLTSFFGKDNMEERDLEFEKRTGVKIYRYPTYFWYSGRAVYIRGFLKFIKELHADVLFLHGEDSYSGTLLLWKYKTMKLPYVLDSHMLEMASKNRFKDIFRKLFKAFITPIILKNDIPLIRVFDSDFVQKNYGIPLEKTFLLSFGTDINYFSPSDKIKSDFRKKNGIKPEDFVVLYAGKLDEHKGGKFFAETLKKEITLDKRNIVFIIVGTVPNSTYGNEVDELLAGSENRILRFSTQYYPDLAQFYQSADIAVFPRQCSMSYFEVQSCGLPVVLERNEINVDRVSEGRGLIFEQDDQDSFIAKIKHFGNMNVEHFQEFKRAAREYIVANYNYVEIAQRFTKIMIDSFYKFHKK